MRCQNADCMSRMLATFLFERKFVFVSQFIKVVRDSYIPAQKSLRRNWRQKSSSVLDFEAANVQDEPCVVCIKLRMKSM